MSRKRRIPKLPEERLRDFESHLYFLWDAVRLYPRQVERYKQIAAELRVLVCRSGKNKPLLLDLMDEYDFEHLVLPPGVDPDGPPVKPHPVPMVGENDVPARRRLQERLDAAYAAGDPDALASIDAEFAALALPVPFREWIDRGVAVFIAPHEYSNKELVLAIAQQAGSAHEDDSVEEPIIQMRQFTIAGHSGELAPLLDLAHYVLGVGAAFIEHLVTKCDVPPTVFNRADT